MDSQRVTDDADLLGLIAMCGFLGGVLLGITVGLTAIAWRLAT